MSSRLRAGEFNSISLETVLCDAGAILQVPMNWVIIMTSGRSHVVDCGSLGSIECVHTAQLPDDVSREPTHDQDRRFWRASVRQALRARADLDFTGENNFKRGDLAELATTLTERLKSRYGLPVKVSEPVKTGGNVFTSKLVIETLEVRLAALRGEPDVRVNFMTEMRRFLPAATVRDIIERKPY